MVEEQEDERVGRRVAVGKWHATVCYVGPVPPAQGLWLGVEWDDPSRGKHNGSHNGVQYFHTSHPTAGSFIRIEKADFGRSCVSAIEERYGSNGVTLTAEELRDLQRAMNAPSIEMVGFEQVNQVLSCFSSLEVVCLPRLQVCCAGGGLEGLCPNARHLDLGSNLFCSWPQVAEVTVHFPSLQFLNVSNNRLKIANNPEELKSAFHKMTHIVLGHMNYSWNRILQCCKMWPQLEKLQVPFNKITNISLPKSTIENLTELDLEGNSIARWEEINKLGTLEKLETLNVCDLGLVNISLPASKNLFKNLQCLMISHNKISKWEDVSELDKLPKLEELKFSHNPVQDKLSVDTIYYKVIVRIGSLKVLNRKTIKEEERRSAEIDYLKEYGQEWLEVSKNEFHKTRFLASHPKFSHIVKKYGAPEQRDMKESSDTMASSMVKVTLQGPDKAVTKTLPKSLPVSSLMSLAKRLFSTGNNTPVLFRKSAQNPDITEEMNITYKSLDFYSVEDGDEISVRW